MAIWNGQQLAPRVPLPAAAPAAPTMLTDSADVYTAPAAGSVMGLRGNDTITGSAGADELFGNQGTDLLVGGDGDDTIYGGQNAEDVMTAVGGVWAYRGGIDTLSGGVGADILYGNHGSDLIYAGDGADTAYGGQDNDSIYGEDGDDLLQGNQGDDLVFGDAGNDTLNGGAGADTMQGGLGSDFIVADDGDHVLLLGDDRPFEFPDTITLVNGKQDTVVIETYPGVGTHRWDLKCDGERADFYYDDKLWASFKVDVGDQLHFKNYQGLGDLDKTFERGNDGWVLV